VSAFIVSPARLLLTQKSTLSRRKSHIKCSITIDTFMHWTTDTLRPFKIGSRQRRHKDGLSKVLYQEKQIPAPYDRVLSQLIAEDTHGDTDRSHEAIRRQTYARQVLDAFVTEFKAYKGPAIRFRSTILTPILQRQLVGVPDAYLPAISKVVGDGTDNPTIGQATKFYCGIDPTDPALIPSYRFNMVFIPEMRWHLGIVLGLVRVGDSSAYKKTFQHQDTLMSALVSDCEGGSEGDEVLRFDAAMIKVLLDERLNIFFGKEMEQVVRISYAHARPP
jgi:hypothetical protein